MAGTLASVLLLITVISLTLIPITALDWASTLLFFHPSRQDVRKLLTSLEDLLLPIGSFLSELGNIKTRTLHRWAPNDLGHESETSTLPLSTTPGYDSSRAGHDARSFTSKPTPEDGRVKRIATTSQINITTHDDVKSRSYKAADRLLGKSMAES